MQNESGRIIACRQYNVATGKRIFLLRKPFQDCQGRKDAELLPCVSQRLEDVAELIYRQVLMHQKLFHHAPW